MPDARSTPQTCLSLRHKIMYIDCQEATPGRVNVDSDTAIFWCGKSQECRGPDGLPATPGTCGSDRPCFEGVGSLRR